MRKFWTILFLWVMFVHIIWAQASKNNGSAKLPIINGAASELPIPVYPEAAKAVCAAGLVEIRVATDESGKVITSEPLSGHTLLIEPALAAARNAKFRVREGIPVVGKVVYNFDAIMIKACEDRLAIILLGPVNTLAKILPMPRLSNAIDLKGTGEILVRVTLDLQKGEVIDAEIKSGGHPMVNAAALKAAKDAKFVPALLEFPPVYGSGLLSYTIRDFNKRARINNKPRPLLITTKDTLNPKALVPFPKPTGIRSGENFIAGTVEIAILIDSRDGKMVTAKAVSGPEELRPESEKAAMKVRFSPTKINSAAPLYVTGIIVYRFNKNGRVD